MAVTGEGKDRYRATVRELLLMPRDTGIPGWDVAPGWQGSAVVRRQAAATDNSMASEHRHPRGKESARPGPGLTRVERGKPASGSTPGAQVSACGGGRPRAIGAELPAGQGAQEANAGSRKATGNRRPRDQVLLLEGGRITGRIPGLVPGTQVGR
jgi:hypothetical protein